MNHGGRVLGGLAQHELMKFDPATGEERPYPSHAAQWRDWTPFTAWIFNPWTGHMRDPRDIYSDPLGLLICPTDNYGAHDAGEAWNKSA